MTITTWPIQERPREKLLAQGANSLSDAELLAIFLRTGIKGKTAVDLARQLLKDFGGLRSLLETHQDTFCQQPGMGSAKFAQIQAAMEISRRHLLESLKRQSIFTNADDANQYLTAQLRHYDHEVFACLFLDNQHRLISYEELFHGSIHSANVYPREVVKKALHFNASAVILAHNHPSGHIKPSAADKQVTTALKKALELVDIRVLDHVIIGEEECASFAQLGLL